MQLFVCAGDSTAVVEVGGEQRGRNLRCSAASRLSAHASELVLTFGGRVVADDALLADLQITTGSTVFASRRLRGGQMFDLTTLIGLILIGIVIIVAIYYVCKYVILGIMWVWEHVLERPTMMTYNWAVIPSGKVCRRCAFWTKEGCCSCAGCCDRQMNPWKRMAVS